MKLVSIEPKSEESASRSLPVRETRPFSSDALPEVESPDATGSNRKVLIVDDNAIVVKAIELKLKGCGYSVITATGPCEGLSAARNELPDAIVLDLNFTLDDTFSSFNWNGLNVLKWFKHIKEVAGIPVIVLTADEPGKSKQLALADGAAAFFQKPVDVNAFLAELRKLTANKSRN